MWLDPLRYEMIDDDIVEILRSKTPAERLEMADSMWRMARDLIRARLRHDHPNWTDNEIAREAAPVAVEWSSLSCRERLS